MRVPLRERLLAKAVINWETGCWEWTANRDRQGYGRITVAGEHALAYRVSYEMTYGPVSPGLQLDHLCRVRHCVNPAHLEAVTSRENTLRGMGVAAVNLAKTHCIHGHEFTPENTYISADARRHCRACHREVVRRGAARARAEISLAGYEPERVA